MPEMKLSELAAALGGELCGEGDKLVRGVAAIESAGPDEVSFFSNAKYEKFVSTTKAAAVIVDHKYAGAGTSLIRCGDPYFAFRQAMVMFYGFRQPHFEGVDARANIEPGVVLGVNVRVGAFATIARGATVGDNTVIYPGAYVGPDSRIGADCTLYANVTLYDRTVLGDRVTVHANSSIGVDGFGYSTHKGRHEKIPQTGYVVLEDDVEIGSCCAIERATMGPTVIGAGTKFADLVAIGHGTKMGKHCLMVSQAGIAGSVTVGDYCIFGGQAGVVGHIRLGNHVHVLAQAGVTNNLPDGIEVLGSPALPRADARRAVMMLTRLPEMREQMREMKNEIDALKAQLGKLSQAPHLEEPQ